MSKPFKKENSEWENVEIKINGKPYVNGEIQEVIYEEGKRIERNFKIADIMNAQTSSLGFKLKPGADANSSHIHFDSKKEMLIVLKRLGLKVFYGKGTFPTSYRIDSETIYPDNKKEFEAFIATITHKEWKEAR